MEPYDVLDLQDLRLSVSYALEMVEAEAAVVEAEICASWCEQQVGHIRYDDTDAEAAPPSPHSHIETGIGILVVIADRDGRRAGFGIERDDLSPEGIKQALEQAKLNASQGPAFGTLPHPGPSQPEMVTFHDPEVLTCPLDDIAGLATEALDGALSTLREAGFVTHLQVHGHVYSRHEHLMLGNTHGLLAGETSTGLLATVLARLTNEQSQGTGTGVATHLQDFSPYDAGVEAANRAIQARGSTPIEGGDYPVIFGPEAVAALLQDLLLPALSLDTVAAGASPFAASYGQQIANPFLTLTDEAQIPRLLGSRTITGEGLPTGTTPLIDQGRLAGFLTDAYHAQALATSMASMTPRNGMRHSLNHQSFGMRPGIFPTNICLKGNDAAALHDLMASIPDGLYIGDLWATSPHGSPQSGNFTSTVIGPSFHIRQGSWTHPIRPGTLRLQANLGDLLQDLTGLSTEPRQVALATGQSLVLTPAARCHRVRVLA